MEIVPTWQNSKGTNMKMKGNFYFLIMIMLFVGTSIVLSLRMQYYTSKLLPLLFGGVVFIAAAIGLRQEILARGKAEATTTGSETSESEKEQPGLRAYLPIGAWIGGFALAIYLLGFIVAILLFVPAYMRSSGIRWSIAADSRRFRCCDYSVCLRRV